MALDGDGRMTTVDRVFLTRLRRVGTVEGISTLVLFGIAMPLKYVGGLPIAVSIVGPIHGVLFMLLTWMFYTGIERVPLSRQLAVWGIVGAVIPFGPFVVDRWLARSHPG